MKLFAGTSAYVVVFVGLAVSAMADDAPLKPKVKESPLPKGYKLDLNTGISPTNTPAPPPGASTLRRESNRPFLGLQLTKPLGAATLRSSDGS